MLELEVHHVHGGDVRGVLVVRHAVLPGVDTLFGEVGRRASEGKIHGRAISIVHLEGNVGVVESVHLLNLT